MRERFTDAEWETLLFAPVLANYVVAMMDGDWDSRESKALVDAVTNACGHEDELTREVCQALVLDFEATFTRLREASKTHTPAIVMAEAARLADSVNRSGSPTPFKQFILEMCLATAEAAAPLVGPKVSEEERLMIREVRIVLGMPA